MHATTDHAGRLTREVVPFTIDTIDPVITFPGFTDGEFRKDPVTPNVTIDEINLDPATIRTYLIPRELN